MNKTIQILLFTLISILFFNCHNKTVQPLQNKIIDAGPFQVTAPSNFKLIKEKGIDSYVGKITNGHITFNFDYGWYSNRGPLTYYDYVDKYLLKLHTEDIKKTCNVSDSTFQRLRPTIVILDAKKNEKYPQQSDKEITTTINVGTGTCTLDLINMIGDISSNYQSYHIIEKVKYPTRNKIYYPIVKAEKNAGVYIENLKEKREKKWGHNKLSIITNDYNSTSSKLILKILKSVKLKIEEKEN